MNREPKLKLPGRDPATAAVPPTIEPPTIEPPALEPTALEPTSQSQPRPRPRLWLELALVSIGYGLYTLSRDAVPIHEDAAFHRAAAILRVEHDLHLDVELTVNHAADRIGPLIVGMNYYYATLHFIVVIGVLVWLYAKDPDAYRPARTVLYSATALGLAGFYFFALAPPRLLPAHGYIDTVVEHHTWGSWASGGVASVSNQYAAMPSVHILWSSWCGLMLYRYAARRWVRVAGIAYPFATFVVIIATANHFVIDAAGGLLTLVAAIVGCRLVYARVGRDGSSGPGARTPIRRPNLAE